MQLELFRKRAKTTYPLLKLTIIIYVYILLSLMLPNTLIVTLLVAFLLGFILAGGLNLAHECLHQTYLNNRFTNLCIGRVFTSVLLINYTLYKEHHLQHHKYVGTEKDTETKIQFSSLLHYFLFMTGFSLAYEKISKAIKVLWQVYPYYIDSPRKQKNALLDSIVICLFLCFISGLTVLFPIAVFNCYWLPLSFSYMWILFFGLPEHLDCNLRSNFYSESRSIRSNLWVRFFLWNGNFHAEHHLYPGLAGSSLQQVFKKNKDCVFYQEKSYFYWHIKFIKKLMISRDKGTGNTCQNC